MACSSTMDTISETTTFPSSTEESDSQFDNECLNDPRKCKNMIKTFLNTGYLKIPHERIRRAVRTLKKHNAIDESTLEQVSLRIFQILLGKKEYVGIIEEIANVNIYEANFFKRLTQVKKFDESWKYQIIEAISSRFEYDELKPSCVQVLCEAIFQFTQFIRYCFPRLNHPYFIAASKSVVISLFKGYCIGKEEIVLHDKENRMTEILQFVKMLLKESEESGSNINLKLQFLEAVHKIEKSNRKQEDVEEGVAILKQLLDGKLDKKLRRFASELELKGEDLITVLNLKAPPDVLQNADDPPACSNETNQQGKKKKKKKRKRSCSVDSLSSGIELVPTPPNIPEEPIADSDSDAESQLSSTQTIWTDDGFCNENMSKMLKFIDHFSMRICDPQYNQRVANNHKSKNLHLLSPSGTTILRAVWSAMSVAVNSRPDWHLRRVSFNNFRSQLKALVKQVDPNIIQDHRILQFVADRYLVQIEIMTGLHDLVPDLSVKPKQNNYKSTIHVLRVGRRKYVGLGNPVENGNPVIADEPFDVCDRKKNDSEAEASSHDLSSQMSELLKNLSWLRERQTTDDFLPNTFGGQMDPVYKVVSKQRLETLLQEEPNNFKKCTIHLQGPHEGYAVPCSETVTEHSQRRDPKEREKIPLLGRRNCGMAFEGDTVVVKVFRTSRGVITSGRVFGVLESTVRPVNQLFFCKVCSDQTTLMKPICGTVPKIHVANDQAEERYEEEYLPPAMQVYEYGKEFGSHTVAHQEQADKRYANKCLVSIYSAQRKDKGVDFKLENVIRIQRHTCELIFVVVYKYWDQCRLYPYGYVVAAFEPACSTEDELAIMRLQWQLPHYYKEEQKALHESKLISRKADDDSMLKGRKDFRDVLTFTIDNEDTEDMDDAISAEIKGNVLEVGVHITDVSQYVMHNGDLDRAARERAITVYGIPNKTKPVHMFPEELSTGRLSLVEGSDRLCLSVIIKFDIETCSMIPESAEDEEKFIVKSIISSNHRLTKKEVTKVLRNPNAETSIPKRTVAYLCQLSHCARLMRERRYGDAAYYHDDPLADFSEVGATIEADDLIEEFMVEANIRVARFLSRKFPHLSLQRVHEPPDSADVDDWLLKHHTDVFHSGYLKRYLNILKIDRDRFYNDSRFFLSSDVVWSIKAAVEKKDFDTPFRLLSDERLHPTLLLAHGKWYSINKLARYEREKLAMSARHNGKCHFGLDAEQYVHFTSPLRRYNDIIIHRLVHAALESRKPPFTEFEIDQIAQTCSEMQRHAKSYDKSLLLYQLYLKAQENPLSLPCVISEITSDRVTLDHRMISKLPLSARSFKHSQLVLDKKPENPTESSLRCQWRERIFIVDQDERTRHPNRRQAVSERRDAFVDSFEKQYYINSLADPMHSLLSRYGTKEWENFFKNCSFEPEQLLKIIGKSQTYIVEDITSEMDAIEKIPDVGQSASAKSRRIVLNPAVTFSMDLTVKKALRAQFTAPAVRSARMRTPKLQYLQLCRSFGICIEHRDNPVLCFGEFVGEPIDERRQFSDVREYQRTWLPVLQMESITESMMDENSYHLRGVKIIWMYDGKKFGGIFCLEDKFCADPFRQIRISSEGDLFDCLRKSAYIDYLCIRYELDDKCWIGHAGVKYTTTVNNKNVIYFAIHQHANPVPMEIINGKRLATIEVIVKTLPKRRQEKAVELLSNVPKSAAVKIAIGDFVAGQGLIQQLDYLDGLWEKNYKSSHLHTANCNSFQRQAIENSFKWPISLIWGPPGTGKTITGVQITFWYCEFNKILNKNIRGKEQDEAADSCEDVSLPQEVAVKDVHNSSKNQGTGKTRNASSSSTTGDSGIGQDNDNKLLEWVNFPSQSDKRQIPAVTMECRKRQVLYCGPSNDCVNCVAEHLRTKVDDQYISLVRIFSEQVELSEFPVPGEDASFSRLNSQVQVPENLLEICLHRLVRNDDKHFATILRKFDAAFKRVSIYLKGKSPDIPTATVGHHKHLLRELRNAAKDYHGILRAAKSLELRLHDVVLCTSAVSASPLVQENCRFTQVIIDEAGMCTEAETLVPLVPVNELDSASAAIENVVLIGDHKQLRPILRNKMAAELGLERSMLQRHWTAGMRKKQQNRTMLKIQYRMHPSICEFPSKHIYNGCLKTGVSQLWSGLGDDDVTDRRQWTGLNADFVGRKYYKSVLENGNANVLHKKWRGIRFSEFRCMPKSEINQSTGVEERVLFLHCEGDEESLTLTTEEGNENSKANKKEVDEVVRIYMELRKRFTQPRNALNSIAVLSQYQHQVHVIAEELKRKLRATVNHDKVGRLFRRQPDKFRKDPSPIVSSVVRSQGSEFDYVILSTVRSLPEYDIDHFPTPGWEKKYLGFITDRNQVNVAITRARKGLIIIGNGKLLKVHQHFWKDFLEDLERRGCYIQNSTDFLNS